jgi:hypothetical protein
MSTKLGTCATQDTPDLPYVQSVQPGTGVTVNDADPRNPIVSATGGGSGFNYTDQSTNYDAEVNDYVLADTTSASFTVTLPTTPVNGATVIVADAKGNWAANSLTVAAGGSDTILSGSSSASTFVCSTAGATLQLTYYLAENWWVLEFIQGTAAGGGSGTVTTVSVVSANGLAGTVANPTTTPAITLSTSITGMLKGNGTAISAAGSSDLPTITLTGDVTGANSGGSVATTLANTAVTPGTYGDGTDAVVVTVDSKGRITSISTDPISGGGGADETLFWLSLGAL